MPHLNKLFFLIILLFSYSIFGDHLLIRSTNNSWQECPALISSFKTETSIDGIFARTEMTIKIKDLYSDFYNCDSMEAELEFSLPEGSAIDSMYLWIYDKPEPAYLKEKSFAVKLYEDIVDRKEDPAILNKNEGSGNYTIKIFPFLRREERTIKICYSSVLKIAGNYLKYEVPTFITEVSENVVTNISCNIVVNNSDSSNIFIENPTSTNPSIEQKSKDFNIEFTFENTIIDEPFEILISSEELNTDGILFQSSKNIKEETLFSAVIKPKTLFDIKQKSKSLLFLWNNVSSNITSTESYQYYYSNSIESDKEKVLNFIQSTCNENDKINFALNDGSISFFSNEMQIYGDSTFNLLSNFIEDSLSKSSKTIRCTPPDEFLSEGLSSLKAEDSITIVIIDNMKHSGYKSDQTFVKEKVEALSKKIPITSTLWWCVRNDNSNLISDIYKELTKISSSLISYIETYKPVDLALNEFSKKYDQYLYPASLNFSSPVSRFPFDIIGTKPEKWNCNKVYHFIGKIHNASKLNISFTGVEGSNSYSYDSTFITSEDILYSNSISNVWAEKKIKSLLSTNPVNSIKKEARNISLDYRILGEYTSLIALEKSVVDSLNIVDDKPSEVFDLDTIFISEKGGITDNVGKIGTEVKEMKVVSKNNSVMISLPSIKLLNNMSSVSLQIYDIRGRLVADLSKEIKKNGRMILWSTTNIAKGSYVIKLCIGKETFSKSFTLVK